MPVPFASQGDKNTIPVTPSTETGQTNYASYQKGFPPVTMTPLVAGGLPPQGMDMNGILFALSSSIGFSQSGGLPTFNADFASTIGGYPQGAVLQSNDGASAYVSTIANNTTDFNESPESIGTSWLPWAGDAAKGSSLYIAVGEGTSDAITATFDPAITELTNGLVVFVRALASNATTTPTFSPDGLTATTITKGTYQPLAIGDIAGNGYWMILQYDSTQGKWVLQNPATGINIVIPSTMPVGAIYVQFAGRPLCLAARGKTCQLPMPGCFSVLKVVLLLHLGSRRQTGHRIFMVILLYPDLSIRSRGISDKQTGLLRWEITQIPLD